MVYNMNDARLKTLRRKFLTKSRPEVENILRQGQLISFHNIQERPQEEALVFLHGASGVNFHAVGPERPQTCKSWCFLGWATLENARCGRTQGSGICRVDIWVWRRYVSSGSLSEKCRMTNQHLTFSGWSEYLKRSLILSKPCFFVLHFVTLSKLINSDGSCFWERWA